MTKEEKDILIEEIKETLISNPNIYLTDTQGLNAEATTRLRRMCFSKGIKVRVVKNALLQKAMERSGMNFEPLYGVLKGNTSLLISEASNAPAQVIKEFRKKEAKPILKGAYVQESIFIGDAAIEQLATLKSKDQLIGDVILLLQSPMKNVISGLKGSGGKLAGILKTLSEREN